MEEKKKATEAANNKDAANIAKKSNILGFSCEIDTPKINLFLESEIKRLSDDGKSVRDIAKTLNISKSKVGRVVRK